VLPTPLHNTARLLAALFMRAQNARRYGLRKLSQFGIAALTPAR